MADSVNQQEELKNEESLDVDDCGKSAIAEKGCGNNLRKSGRIGS